MVAAKNELTDSDDIVAVVAVEIAVVAVVLADAVDDDHKIEGVLCSEFVTYL